MKILEKVAKDMPADTIFIAGHAKDGLPATVDRKAVLRFRDYFDAVLTLARKGDRRGANEGGRSRRRPSCRASRATRAAAR